MQKNTLLASDALIYKDLVESSPDLICRFLPDTTVTFANEALCRALEIDRSELLGRHFSELIPPEEVQPAREKVGSLSADGHADILRRHHERLDGSGYPQGLKNEEIPLEARIVAVADTVEAMASHRPYRPSLGVDTALRFVEEGKDRLFDRNVVDACSELFAEGYSFESDGAAPALLH